MNIVICDDDPIYRQYLSNVIDGILMNKRSNSQIVLETDDPSRLLEYARTENLITLYFLDIVLDEDISGLDIASEIRKRDGTSIIVIITNHPDDMSLVYEYKLEALDFIFKGDTLQNTERIKQCIEIAEKRQQKGYEDCLNIQNYSENLSVPYDDIYFIDTVLGTHKLAVHTNTALYEFYGKLNVLNLKLDYRFIRCHKSVIVNTEKIIGVDKSNHRILLLNGYTCQYSRRLFDPDSIYR